MTIKTALATLAPEERAKLMAAFNEIKPFMILLKDNLFLAVHTEPQEKFQVIEKSAYWLLGRKL